MKVVVGGPPHSGKSTFTAALIETIGDRLAADECEFSFDWLTLDVTDNSLSYLLDRSGATPRRKAGVEWTEATARDRAATFARCPEQLVLADTPGLLTPELDIVIAPADAIVILAHDEEFNRIHQWERKAEECDLEVLATFVTVFGDDQQPFWDRTTGEGVVESVDIEAFRAHRLDAYGTPTLRIIRQLSQYLIDRTVQSLDPPQS